MQLSTSKPTPTWAHLKAELRQFGLNPSHWRLKWLPCQNKIELRNRANPEIQFYGTYFANQGEIHWVGLELQVA